ncbi:MAG: HAD-IA family hydrolase [Candidatus Aminicenantes bacterium]|uniref:HAD-superfamily hydrolase n=1 Tax=Candidatus Saccharicenans subterraneus TaxID=2508984 RepID=A0A3E2BM40_9BACT|nr:HAD-IA family hydrolase [Candidatus Aminicenantes bacterium]RFT15798.1 MAG: HAD-superfamily hydrolase [Candidatus Saccharicenans subterraneum]
MAPAGNIILGMKMKLKLVIFDLDGTVVENSYDWPAIKRELGVPAGSILAYLDSLPEPQKSEKYALLRRYEKEQTENSVLKEGVREFLDWLAATGVNRALVTNNSQDNTRHLLEKFGLEFDLVLTRESGLHKPAGTPFLRVMERFGVRASETAVVGDTNYDLLAAREAGIKMVFILKSPMTPAGLEGAELVATFDELRKRIQQLVPG